LPLPQSPPRPSAKLACWAVLLAIASASLANPVGAQTETRVRFVPQVVELSVGERATVEIHVEDLPPGGLAALQLDLAFDAALLTIGNPNEAFRDSVLPFAPLGDDAVLCETVRGVTPCPDPPWLLTATGRSPLGTDVLGADRALFAYGTSGTVAPPSGNGVIGLIDVVGTQAGASLVGTTRSILADDAETPVAHPFVTDALIVVTGTGLPDADADGIPDAVDNCQQAANGSTAPDPGGSLQLDGDGDGFGNFCDADLNNDGLVDFLDLGLLKAAFFGSDPAADLNGDGVVEFLDLGRLKALFFQPPGPSGRLP